MLDPARLDEAIARAVQRAIELYEAACDEKKITKAQLAGFATRAESLGSKGLVELIESQIKRNKQNEAASAEGKGTVRPKNPGFWRSMKRVVEEDLSQISADHEDADAVHRLFATRLAIELRYQAAIRKGT